MWLVLQHGLCQRKYACRKAALRHHILHMRRTHVQPDFSQVIIRESGKLRLLMAGGIARWVERRTEDPIIDASDTTVTEALKCEVSGRFRIMRRRPTVNDARETFIGRCVRVRTTAGMRSHRYRKRQGRGGATRNCDPMRFIRLRGAVNRSACSGGGTLHGGSER